MKFRDFLTNNGRTTLTRTEYLQDDALPADGYAIRVFRSGHGQIRHNGPRAAEYARRALAHITDGRGMTLVGEIEDNPAFPMRGIIEGYYGKPYTWQQRLDILDFLDTHRMNTYFYAPKDDRYHRDLWRQPYPREQLDNIGRLVEHARRRNLMFYFCMSPGKDFRYTCREDYDTLLEKFRQVEALGVEDFAILFDDISPNLTEQEARVFESPAHAHCHVANWLNKQLHHTHRLVICPTDYYQNTDTPYRQEMRKHLDADIQVIWTGYQVIAEAIPERDCVMAQKTFQRELVLWDNYPVNDYPPRGRIYLDAICNRTSTIAGYHVGAISNTSELWETSKFMLMTYAQWMWNPQTYDPEQAYLEALDAFVGRNPFRRFFAGLNRSSSLRQYPDNGALFAGEQWDALDAHYGMMEAAIEHTARDSEAALLQEWQGLLRYGNLECALYRALRAGEPLAPILERLRREQYHFADQSLLRYIAQKGLAEDLTRPEKEIFWETAIK